MRRGNFIWRRVACVRHVVCSQDLVPDALCPNWESWNFTPSCKEGAPPSPSLLPGKALIQQCENLGYIKLYVFEVEIFLIVFLHL